MRKWFVWSLLVFAVTLYAAVADAKSPFYSITGGGMMFSESTDAMGAVEELKDFGGSPYYSIGAGYRTGWRSLRVEGTFDHYLDYDMRIRSAVPEDGGAVVLRPKRHGAAYSGWLWAFMDLEELRWKRLQPFVGVGLGLTYFDSYPTDGARPAYGASVGLAFELTDTLTVDIGYRYVDLSPFSGRVQHDHHGFAARLRMDFG